LHEDSEDGKALIKREGCGSRTIKLEAYDAWGKVICICWCSRLQEDLPLRPKKCCPDCWKFRPEDDDHLALLIRKPDPIVVADGLNDDDQESYESAPGPIGGTDIAGSKSSPEEKAEEEDVVDTGEDPGNLEDLRALGRLLGIVSDAELMEQRRALKMYHPAVPVTAAPRPLASVEAMLEDGGSCS
jgi:hypothetical protein